MCYIIRLSTRKNTFNSFTTDVTFLFVDKSWNKVIFKFMIFVVSWLEKICSGHFLFTIKQGSERLFVFCFFSWKNSPNIISNRVVRVEWLVVWSASRENFCYAPICQHLYSLWFSGQKFQLNCLYSDLQMDVSSSFIFIIDFLHWPSLTTNLPQLSIFWLVFEFLQWHPINHKSGK